MISDSADPTRKTEVLSMFVSWRLEEVEELEEEEEGKEIISWGRVIRGPWNR